jgi:recombinational DNA repair protein (RecF pathway)
LAKGARRPKSRLQGTLEPFARIAAMLGVKDPDRLGTLGETALLAGWPYLRDDLERLAYAGLGIEIVGRLAEVSPPEPFFFEEACRFLEGLGTVRGAGSLTIALLLRLLCQGGFPPRLDASLSGERLPDALAYDFEAAAFVAIGPGLSSHAMRLPGRAVTAIAPALAAPPPLDGRFRVPAEAGPVLLRWLVRVWEDHLAARLRAAEFLEKMVLAKR